MTPLRSRDEQNRVIAKPLVGGAVLVGLFGLRHVVAGQVSLLGYLELASAVAIVGVVVAMYARTVILSFDEVTGTVCRATTTFALCHGVLRIPLAQVVRVTRKWSGVNHYADGWAATDGIAPVALVLRDGRCLVVYQTRDHAHANAVATEIAHTLRIPGDEAESPNPALNPTGLRPAG